MWNSLQPERPKEDLLYRTHISSKRSTYNVYDPKNMVAQVMLYNKYATNEMFPVQVSVDDLYHYLQCPDITKRQVGRTVLESLQYDPRILKGVTRDNPKACMTYVINDPREIQYGLEWMICMWHWRIDESIVDSQTSAEILAEMGALESMDLMSLWVEPILNGEWAEKRAPGALSWADLWDKHGWEYERPPAPTGSKPAFLRDLSSGRE